MKRKKLKIIAPQLRIASKANLLSLGLLGCPDLCIHEQSDAFLELLYRTIISQK